MDFTRVFVFFSLLVCLSVSEKLNTKFVAILYHHGARTPSSPPLTNEFKWVWSESSNQITSNGLGEDFELGKRLKMMYVDTGFIEENGIDAQDSILVYASSSDRALQSAQTVMRGMFGVQDDLQKVPVHGAVDRMLDGWRSCPSVVEMKNAALFDPSWERMKVNTAYLKTLKLVKESTGLSVDLENWSSLYDWVLCANATKTSKDSLPKKMTKEIQDLVVGLGNWVNSRYFVFESTELLAPLTSGVILQDILNNMDLAAKGKTTRRMIIYSAHSENIMGLLRIFRLFDLLGKPPSYSSMLSIELTERDSDKRLFVVLRYEGAKVATIPDCPDRGTDCSYESVRVMLQPFTENSFVEKDWINICDKDVTLQCPGKIAKKDKPLHFLPLWTVGGILAGAIATTIIILIAWRWYRNRGWRSRQEVMNELEIE